MIEHIKRVAWAPASRSQASGWGSGGRVIFAAIPFQLERRSAPPELLEYSRTLDSSSRPTGALRLAQRLHVPALAAPLTDLREQGSFESGYLACCTETPAWATRP
ncbi:hypothetical protein [Streptomyces sp. NPDC058595]|uniref:hypothetical protein n=1 Tax=Streptomyces sp. NPDC058595 TaxID=3346550 RepID=UPI0036659C38